MRNSGTSFFGFIAGVAVGALLGVLYAPDKGKNTRDKLSYQLDKYLEELENIMSDLMQERDQAVSQAKTETNQRVSDTVEKAEKLMSEANALINQMAQQKEEKE